MIKRVLHPTDFTDASKVAFDRAVHLTDKLDASLEVFHVLKFYEFDAEHSKDEYEHLVQAHRTITEHAEASMQKLGSRVKAPKEKKIEFRFSKGRSAGNEIVIEAERRRSDLIVMGPHGDTPVRQFFLGSATEYVVRYAPCPVLILGRSQTKPSSSFKKILMATDFSRPSHAAAALAIMMAKIDGARVEMIHVIDDLHRTSLHPTVAEPKGQSSVENRAREKMAHFVETYRHSGMQIVTRIEYGRPSTTIAAIAEQEGFDLIVMATSGIRGLDLFIVGSAAARVLRVSHVPVLVTKVKPENHDSNEGG